MEELPAQYSNRISWQCIVCGAISGAVGKVMDKKCDQSEFRVGLKMKKYGENKATKEKIERVAAFGEGTANS